LTSPVSPTTTTTANQNSLIPTESASFTALSSKSSPTTNDETLSNTVETVSKAVTWSSSTTVIPPVTNFVEYHFGHFTYFCFTSIKQTATSEAVAFWIYIVIGAVCCIVILVIVGIATFLCHGNHNNNGVIDHVFVFHVFIGASHAFYYVECDANNNSLALARDDADSQSQCNTKQLSQHQPFCFTPFVLDQEMTLIPREYQHKQPPGNCKFNMFVMILLCLH
jgi:hypothetical protein